VRLSSEIHGSVRFALACAYVIRRVGLSGAYCLYSRSTDAYIVTSLTSKTPSSNLPTSSTTSLRKVPTAASGSSSGSSSTTKSSALAAADAKASARKALRRATTAISGPRAPNHLSLFFGSQTGTAEDFARQVAKEAKALGFAPAVVDLEDYDASTDLVKEKFAIFFMATYGEGEPTDNAKKFYQFITSTDAATTSLKDVHFAVFGLGNKTYEHYNTSRRHWCL
jgi:sulfite reductase alpha subunit-like flavoprotein